MKSFNKRIYLFQRSLIEQYNSLNKKRKEGNMAKKTNKQKIKIDDVEYNYDNLSENAKAQLASIQFVDAQIQQLNSEWAVADTARIGYTNALKSELAKKEIEA